MQKLWTFGDSYTYCSGYNYNLEYSTLTHDIRQKLDALPKESFLNSLFKYREGLKLYRELLMLPDIELWPNLVAKRLGVKQVNNKGVPGFSNEQILDSLIGNLGSIEPGDIVVIGTTRGGRLTVPVGNLDTRNNVRTTSCAVLDVLFRDIAPESTPHRVDAKFYDFSEFSKEQYLSLVDYRYNVLTTERSYDLELSYVSTLKKLASYLSSLNVKVLIWDSTLWNEYENIGAYTQQRISDGHWSHNGFKDFSKLISHCIEKGVEHIDVKVKNKIRYKTL